MIEPDANRTITVSAAGAQTLIAAGYTLATSESAA